MEPPRELHKDDTYHLKSFDTKQFIKKRPVPDSNFSNPKSFPTQGLASHEPRARGVSCYPAEFGAVSRGFGVPRHQTDAARESESPSVGSEGHRVGLRRWQDMCRTSSH